MSKALLSDAVDDYLRFRLSQDYSKATVKVERVVLKRLLATTGNIYLHALNERQVERYFEEASRTRQASSLRNDHGALSRFFEWARKTGRVPMDHDPLYGRRLPRLRHKEHNRVPVTEFGRLLDCASAKDPRDRMAVALLLYTLLRDSDATALKVRDVDLDRGNLMVYIHKTRIEDVMPICSELDSELRTWLTLYGNKVGGLRPHYYLVPSRRVSPVMSAETGRIVRVVGTYQPENRLGPLGRIVTPILEDFGFPVRDENGKSRNEGAHTIRRSGARALFDALAENGYDQPLRVVQSMLHHKNSQQTEHYLGITADRRSRDELLRGNPMYPSASGNVVRLAR